MPRLSLADNYNWGDTRQRTEFLHLWTVSPEITTTRHVSYMQTRLLVEDMIARCD